MAVPFWYHWYAYGDVPPTTVELRVWDWPTSRVAEEGEAVTARAPLTLIVAVLDVTCIPILSVAFM